MIAGGFAFKTASVPFHFWAPEAYEGAPAPCSAFLSSASKAAGFVLAFRAFAVAFPIGDLLAAGGAINWVMAFQILAIATMFIGNFAAATHETVKRMLAYSASVTPGTRSSDSPPVGTEEGLTSRLARAWLTCSSTAS